MLKTVLLFKPKLLFQLAAVSEQCFSTLEGHYISKGALNNTDAQTLCSESLICWFGVGPGRGEFLKLQE